ncbi:MAG: FtsX-like permease family protein [Vicinamibacterales bacterium]
MRLDFVQALRSIRARPAATIGLAAVVAIGIGLVTVMFALADPFLLKSLPYPNSDRIVVINAHVDRAKYDPWNPPPLSPSVDDLNAREDLFQAVAAHRNPGTVRFRLAGGDAVVYTAAVTGRFVEVLGLPPQSLEPGEGLLTHGGARRLSTEPLSERSLPKAGGGAVHVRGVLPPSFLFPTPRALFPYELLVPGDSRDARLGSASIIARLQRGVTPLAARDAIRGMTGKDSALNIEIETIDHHMTKSVRPLALGALLAGLLILLVSVANAANLVLARCVYRGREFATRAAIGASRLDIGRLVVIELALIAVIGALAALVLAQLSLVAAARLMPVEYQVLGAPGLTLRAIIFAAAMAGLVVAAGAAISLPAWRARTFGGTFVPSGRDASRIRIMRFALASGQTAVAMILLASAALLVRSQFNLVTQDTGYDGNVLVATASYDPAHLGIALREDMNATLHRLRRIPGVSSTAASGGGMLDRSIGAGGFSFQGQMVRAAVKQVTPGYFETVGSRVLAGRTLRAEDANFTGMVITESLAREFGEPAAIIGKRGGRNAEIVGVIRDEFFLALDRQPAGMMFTVMRDAERCTGNGCDNRINYVIRATGDSAGIEAQVRHAITSVNGNAIVTNVGSIDERLADSVRDRSFATMMLVLFAAAGTAVCAAGLLSVVGFAVTRRTREIAIRVAIGATPRAVLRTVVLEGVTAAICGIAAGLIINQWLSKGLQSLSYGVQPGDAATTAAGAALMIATAAIGVVIPARRALRLSPSDGLRVD